MLLPPFVALYLWPVACIAFFRKYRLQTALCAALLGGYLLLPEKTSFNLPLLPQLDKQTVPAMTALVAVLLVAGASRNRWQTRPAPNVLRGLLPRHPAGLVLLGVLVAGSFLTVLTNGDSVRYGSAVLPGMRPYDGFAAVLAIFMSVLPMLLARKVLARPGDHRLLLGALAIGGFAYSFLALIEVRMSPQLNIWIYGFFQHSFIQHYRGGGVWRPVVFLPHGLWLSIFFMATAIAACGLWRLKAIPRKFFGIAGIWLLGTLILSTSLGAMMITAALLPVALLLRPRGQLVVASVIAAIFLTYPVLRSADQVPLDRVLNFAESINPDRAGSFRTRILNEDIMLAKALQRPVFGWGGWGRSRVIDSSEGNTAGPIADGYWTIVLGVGGWTRYIAEFGLLTAPIFLLLLGWRRRRPGLETGIIAIILAGNLIDLIPNATITPVTWLLAGALWGRLEVGQDSLAEPAIAAGESARPGNRRASGDPPEAPSHPVQETSPLSAYTRQTRRVRRGGNKET
ncbi:hypothetical protein [Rhodovulum visakhapatnamense]|uniref:O-antigen ligase-like membrane protein n=1 Tax=Rhodovulum visakhapatnamense TaxID=364297 RepID=A0A4R8F8E5_9RHOB|nr:hypothetical protein [Rhodovulum visakhapatnamense]TDX21874.1 hypothetical protein EV657_13510 [Rhodovulum visakhapatnamense]